MTLWQVEARQWSQVPVELRSTSGFEGFRVEVSRFLVGFGWDNR